jgi:alanine racemase
MIEQGIKMVLVAKLYEAIQLREAGLDIGIVSIDPLFSETDIEKVVKYNITQTIYQSKAAEKLNRAAIKAAKIIPIWAELVYTGARQLNS